MLKYSYFMETPKKIDHFFARAQGKCFFLNFEADAPRGAKFLLFFTLTLPQRCFEKGKISRPGVGGGGARAPCAPPLATPLRML